MDRENLKKAFEALKDCVGDSLHLILLRFELSEAEFAQKIGKEESFLVELRSNEREITFEELEQICQTLGWSVVDVLKVAQIILDAGNMSPREQLETAKRELDYSDYKKENS